MAVSKEFLQQARNDFTNKTGLYIQNSSMIYLLNTIGDDE